MTTLIATAIAEIKYKGDTMITPTTELLKEAIEDTDELIEYVLSSSGDPNLPEWLKDLKRKIHTAYCRLTSPVAQQEDL